MFKILLFFAFVFTIANVQAIDYDEYVMAIEELSMNPLFLVEYEKHIGNLMEMEPNYFNFTPFASNDYKFDCSLNDFDSPHEEATSVHRLRPRDIKARGIILILI